MAVVLRLTVSPGTQAQFDALEVRVGEAMEAAGGPPEGLMSHVVNPEGQGFVVTQVWRTEQHGRAHIDDHLRQQLEAEGLTLVKTEVAPVWSFARP